MDQELSAPIIFPDKKAFLLKNGVIPPLDFWEVISFESIEKVSLKNQTNMKELETSAIMKKSLLELKVWNQISDKIWKLAR